MSFHMPTRAALLAALLAAAVTGGACRPSPTSAPGAGDLRATLDTYLGGLPDGWGEISPALLNDQIQAAAPFLVDLREAGEIASVGYVAGSINISIRSLMRNLDKLPPQDRPIVLTCGSGARSAMAMEALQLLGYTHLKSLTGGLAAWKAAGLPLATGTPPEAPAGKAPAVDKNLLALLDHYLGGLPNGWYTIGPATVRDLVSASRPFQLDVREPREIADTGFIAGSTSIPIRTLMRHLDQLPPDKGALIVAECPDGHRSVMAMMALHLLGYNEVRTLADGLASWTRAKLPLQK